jgi:hypothetical protein
VPRGPKGEKRPADVIGNAVHVCGLRRGRLRNLQLQNPGAFAAAMRARQL